MNNVWVDPRIREVTVEAVRGYLLEHGWSLQSYPRPELLVFGGPLDDDGQPIVLVLPSSERYRDYLQRVEELLASLSILEERPVRAILEELLQGRNGEGTPTQPNGAASSPALGLAPDSEKTSST